MAKTKARKPNQPTQPTHPLDRLYNKGYFHGETSGYGKEGYAEERPDRSALIQAVKQYVRDSARWLDVGCAYGFQIEEAAKAGFDACGVDISSYALGQYKNGAKSAAQAVAEQLPYVNGSVDVVSAFDLVEHLHDPAAFIDEAERVLSTSGVLLIATPDPIYFKRPEPTHVFERPPSFWAHELVRRGFTLAVRFGAKPYEVEIAAVKTPTEHWAAFKREFESQTFPAASLLESNGVHAAVRNASSESLWHDGDRLYALNADAAPVRLRVEFESDEERHFDVFFGDLKLRYAGCRQTSPSRVHTWHSVSFSPGGRELSLVNGGDGIAGTWRLIAEPIAREDYTLELAFDHYQRYRFVSQILPHIAPDAKRILDVGGALGRLPLFFPDAEIEVIDCSWEDAPWARIYDGSRLPYDDASFDAVVSIDTLEHVPPQQREPFLQEVARVSRDAVLICGPFHDPDVIQAEAALRDFAETQLELNDRFLHEHAEYELPPVSLVSEELTDLGYSVMGLPNGYLPRWLAMQCAEFILGKSPESAGAKARVNKLYNANYYDFDNCTPAYRIAVIATREPLPDDAKRSLSSLISRGGSNDGGMWNIANLAASIGQFRLVHEQESHLRQRSMQQDQLLKHIQNLEESLHRSQTRNENLHEHTENLDQLLKELHTHMRQQDASVKALIAQQDVSAKALITQQDASAKALIARQDAGHISHIKNLEHAKNETVKHAENLEQHAKNVEQHAKYTEQLLADQQKHASNLQAMLQNMEGLVQQKGEETTERDAYIQSLRERVIQLASKSLSIAASDASSSRSEIEIALTSLISIVSELGGDNGGLSDALNSLLHQVGGALEERDNLRERLESYQRSRRYRFLRRLGLAPKLEDSPAE
ncbi:MAG: methyltransferase domain-containing protein [Candidatus Hinthialibacter antarcticus]|nr:methyltransferase domain-containing protein [Candidatus Hinthialibacter antarcticus]